MTPTETDCCHKNKCPREGEHPQQPADSRHQEDSCATIAIKNTNPVNPEFKEIALDVTPVHPTEGTIGEFAQAPTSFIELVISSASPPDRNILNVSFLI